MFAPSFMRIFIIRATFFLAFLSVFGLHAQAQEAYFVTESHQLEERGNLEVTSQNVIGRPAGGSRFLGSALEFEYGAKEWWTTEFYLDGQSTAAQSTTFSGFRWENRFRPFLREHWINPVIYAEFENVDGAEKALLDVVGHDTQNDFVPRVSRAEKKREAELRLILSKNVGGWNFSQNTITEKNLEGGAWEFGYSLGVSHTLARRSLAASCTLCRSGLTVAAELYGGLGDRHSFGLRNTSHYLAPGIAWEGPRNFSFKLSPGFGLNSNSQRFLLRVGASYEFEQVFSRWKQQ